MSFNSNGGLLLKRLSLEFRPTEEALNNQSCYTTMQVVEMGDLVPHI